jgi:hypothetical protein
VSGPQRCSSLEIVNLSPNQILQQTGHAKCVFARQQADSIALAGLKPADVKQAITKLGINPEKLDPMRA